MIINLLFISLAIQIIMFLIAFKFKTDKFTDISYALTFPLLALISYAKSDTSVLKLLMLVLVFAWALRLGIYLFVRINKIGRDKRFDKIRINFYKFLSFWVLQGITVFAVLLPVFLFFSEKAVFSPLIYLGGFIFVFGLAIEGFADKQKFDFRNDEKNKGKWVDVGLWKYSRHPNYLGEMLVWIGAYVYAFSSLSLSYKLLALIGPLTIISLLLFVTGIPKLEEKAEKKWGSNKDYKRYKESTALLVPFVY